MKPIEIIRLGAILEPPYPVAISRNEIRRLYLVPSGSANGVLVAREKRARLDA